MFICGKNYVGGKNACAFTPTSVNNITKVELKNGIYDYLFLTQDTTLDVNNELQEDWDYNTLLYAKFNGNTNAGNIDKCLEETTHLIIKSRKVGDFEWQTLAVKEVHTIEDFALESLYFDEMDGSWKIGGDITDLVLSDTTYTFLMISYSLEAI